MTTQPERESALPGASGHPADSLPARQTAAQRAAEQRAAQQRTAEQTSSGRTLSPVPDPEPEPAPGPDNTTQMDESDPTEHDTPDRQERTATAPKKKARTSGRTKTAAAQSPSLSRLESKQLKKSVSDAAYASAAATRKAQERLDELVETIERAVADGLPPIVIEAELLAACAASEVELPLDDLRRLLRP